MGTPAWLGQAGAVGRSRGFPSADRLLGLGEMDFLSFVNLGFFNHHVRIPAPTSSRTAQGTRRTQHSA